MEGSVEGSMVHLRDRHELVAALAEVALEHRALLSLEAQQILRRAYIVMAYIVMAYIVLAYTVMAYIVMSPCLYSYGIHSYGLYSYVAVPI